jgi:glycosyltransferase involved in cell wall biosynthesis
MPSTVHLVNPFTSATGGSEWHTLSLFEVLAEFTEVNLWTEFKPDPSLTGKYPIRAIEPGRGLFPKGGTIVFVGVYFGISGWLRHANPRRVVVFFNTPDFDRLEPFVDGIRAAGISNIDVAYQAEHFRDRFPDLPGPVHTSPIDLNLFSPQLRKHNGFIVGRYSRDNADKHHDDNPELYRRLAEAGCGVRIMGGLSQRDKISDDRVELTSSGAVPPWEFLYGLDCFLYRIHPDIYEAFGRVVAESMACGVPVVAENRGGFTKLINSGVNGFLFDTNDEAFQQVMLLREDVALRKSMGEAARESMVELYSPAAQAEMAEFYYR